MNPQQSNMLLPLLGPLTRPQLEEIIRKSIIDEASAADFYGRLLKEAPDKLNYEFIKKANDEELKHLGFFQKLYRNNFGKDLQYKIVPVRYSNYKEGILMALKDELEAADFYRDVQLSVKEKLIRDTFYLAMVDELEHATRFSTLYNQLR